MQKNSRLQDALLVSLFLLLGAFDNRLQKAPPSFLHTFLLEMKRKPAEKNTGL